jgi:hypothetical protein
MAMLGHRTQVLAAEAQTYSVPRRYSAELAADRWAIAEREAIIGRLKTELRRLAQECQTEAEIFKSKVENYKLEYRQGVNLYCTRLAQVAELARQRKVELEAELARNPLNVNDPPPLYNAKVFRRNEARARFLNDVSEAERVMRTLREELALKAAASRSKLQAVEKAYRETSAARKNEYDARRKACESHACVLNQLVDFYNAKLERCGTPVPDPTAELTGTAINP